MFHLHFIWIWILMSINAHLVREVCRRWKTPRGCVTPGRAGPGSIWGNRTCADSCSRAGPVIRLWRPGFSGPGRV